MKEVILLLPALLLAGLGPIPRYLPVRFQRFWDGKGDVNWMNQVGGAAVVKEGREVFPLLVRALSHGLLVRNSHPSRPVPLRIGLFQAVSLAKVV